MSSGEIMADQHVVFGDDGADALEGVAPDNPERDEERGPPRRGRLGRQPLPFTSTQTVVFIFAAVSGLWHGDYGTPADQRYADGQPWLLGAVVGQWRLIPLDNLWLATENPDDQDLIDRAQLACRAAETYGVCVYEVLQVIALSTPFVCLQKEPPGILRALRGLGCNLRGPGGDGPVAPWEQTLRAATGGPVMPNVPMWLGPMLAIGVMMGRRMLFHAIEVGKKCRAPRQFGPSRAVLARFRAGIQPAKRLRRDREEGLRQAPRNTMPADIVIDWLNATKNEKDLKKRFSSAAAWSRLLARGGPD